MTITFAGIPWHSSVKDVTAILQTKGFTVSQKDSYSLVARGLLFGTIVGVLLTFDIRGLCEVHIFREVNVRCAWDEYDLIKGVLLEKYGRPLIETLETVDQMETAIWEEDQLSDKAEVKIIMGEDHKAITICYKSSEAKQALQDEIEQAIRQIKNRYDAIDLL